VRKLSLLFAVLFVVGVRDASACECVDAGPNLTAKEWLAKLDGVAFTGRVLDVSLVDEPTEGNPTAVRREVTFEVEEVWKGDVHAEIKVRTGWGGGDCGITFVKGEKYFVEATPWMGHLSTGVCDKTAKYASADKLLRELGRGKKPARVEKKEIP
jgi:hypothetical protein